MVGIYAEAQEGRRAYVGRHSQRQTGSFRKKNAAQGMERWIAKKVACHATAGTHHACLSPCCYMGQPALLASCLHGTNHATTRHAMRAQSRLSRQERRERR